jgi:hypothetical protein
MPAKIFYISAAGINWDRADESGLFPEEPS